MELLFGIWHTNYIIVKEVYDTIYRHRVQHLGEIYAVMSQAAMKVEQSKTMAFYGLQIIPWFYKEGT